MKLPQELIEKIKLFCQENGFGMGEVGSEDYIVILIGNRKLSPDQVSLLGAHALLEGIIRGEFFDANESLLKEDIH